MALLGAPLVALVVLSAPAGAVPAGDEGSFRAAWTTGTTTSIELTADITLTCTNGAGNGVSARNSSTTIVLNGNGHTITQTCRTGTNNGVLAQIGEGDVTLQNLTLTGGQTTSSGGGFRMTQSNTPSLTVMNSTISGNFACGVGGGIAHDTSGTVTIIGSTLSGNTTNSDGGGVDMDGGALLVKNSTINGNKSTSGDAGIDSDASQGVTLVYTTLVGNTATVPGSSLCAGAGSVDTAPGKIHARKVHTQANQEVNLFVGGNETLQAFGTVIANPLSNSGTPVNCEIDGSTNSNGFNYSTDSSCQLNAGTDTQNGPDPKLGALGNNGGPTLTMLPQTGSPLIDGVAAASCKADGAAGITTDQRILPRPDSASPACDIGAVEVQPAVLVVQPRFTG